MSDPTSSPPAPGNLPREELQTVLFLDLVAQHANMALMFLGRVPHPQTGKQVVDLENARLFIDQLEMLEAKTRGNLNKREEGLLKQSLMATRMAFVESVAKPAGSGSKTEAAAGTTVSAPPQEPPAEAAPTQTEEPPQTVADAADRKKFSKKY
jgi:hypothetical protein